MSKIMKIEKGQITGKWSPADSAKLRELYEADVPMAEICKTLHRSKKSVQNKVIHSMPPMSRPIKTATQ